MILVDYLIRAMEDRRLTRRDLRVLGVLAAEFNPARWDRAPYVPVKLRWLAGKAGIHTTKASASLAALVRHQYLAPGPMAGSPGRQVRTYRLRFPDTPEGVAGSVTLPAA